MQYEIKGTPLPVVICSMEANEVMISESGAMAWMSPGMKMETTSNGGVGKMVGRLFSGESMFQNRYTAVGAPGMIAFASSFPGQIIPMEIHHNAGIIAQKSAFLAAQSGVELSVHFQKKLGAAFFGGEGLIMQRLSGEGLAFLEIDGALVQYNLQPGESMVIDTGYLALMDESVQFDVRSIPGAKNVLFGGEGLFNTYVSGPGRIWLQTMPISQVAGSMQRFLVHK